MTLPRPVAVLLALMLTALLAGCVQVKAKRGVEVGWDSPVVQNMVKGETTRAEVLDALGPPSQIISLEDETVLYYMFEKAEGEGVIFILYNNVRIDTRYDRAVFFFDEEGVLTDFSSRVHAHDDE